MSVRHPANDRRDAGEPAKHRRDAAGVTIAPSTDVEAIRRLGIAAGLEDTGREGERFAAAWLAHDRTGRAVGAVALERCGGLDLVDWMSVDEAARGRGVGARLLRALEDEARARGVRRLYATARAPGFFLANGYVELPDGEVSRFLVGDCVTCPQFQRGCEPRPMAKDLGPAAGDAGTPGEA